ncbi:hypothetical protein CPB84DRAFT_1776275 [Gymnopilus junonius]|uniref:F-box domain-containing protein n=1 Tax=Gymnopilus junonius TaxID=109634 RepID=A0A9P5TPQ2_GYMJU|nr:hypothetical protein CPB84DRAFT_1776275 [Gymnopilus junonius]
MHRCELVSRILRKRSSPFVLGKVRQSWRMIAWSTPCLWKYIIIAVDHGDTCEPNFKFLLHHIKHSG